MHKFVSAVFCEKAIVDARTNQVSAIGIIESIVTPGFPMVAAGPFSVFSVWYLDKDLPDGPEIITRNELKLPSGQLKIPRGQMSLPRTSGFHRMFTDLLVIPLDESGLYEIQIMFGPIDNLVQAGAIRFLAASDPEGFEEARKQLAELK